MEQLLYWYSKNNSTIIQSLIVIVGLTLCFFIYKILFGQNQKNRNNEDSSQKSTAIVESIETKINQILESQSKNNNSKKELDSEIPATSEEAAALIEKIQAENISLKQVIKDQETLNINYSSGEKSKGVSPSGAASAASATANRVDVSSYEKEIEDLKSRLSDYEVISEDISDLHKLREENKKLKDQIQNGQPAVAVVEDQAKTSTQDADEPAVEKVISVAESESEISSSDINTDISTENVSENKIDSNENNLVTDEEKTLIEQFEKNKGS